MTQEERARQDALYENEPWAKLAIEAGFRPYDTESAAREAFRFAAEKYADIPDPAALVASHRQLVEAASSAPIILRTEEVDAFRERQKQWFLHVYRPALTTARAAMGE